MGKTFYTERDIEDMVKRGVMSLTLNDHIVLTDLAYERARRLGVSLIQQRPDLPPSSPVRPYLTNSVPGTVQPASAASGIVSMTVLPGDRQPINPGSPISAASNGQKNDSDELRKRIREAVISRLGERIDANLLESAINRALDNAGIK